MKKIIFILAGVLFVVVGIFFLVKGNDKAKNCTEEAVGTIVDIRDDISSDEGEVTHTYYPIIEYKAGDKTIKKEANISTNEEFKYRVNDKIDILYNPNNVEEYMIKGDKSSNIIGIVFIVLGALAAVGGVFAKVY